MILTRNIIQRVRQIQIRTGRQVADVLAGEYVSTFKGTGVEFDEVRPYIPGDDVRTIDWNVSARIGQPYVKRYVEERQLTVMLLIDVSASQDFGSGHRTKRETAAELCALLAFSAIENDDKVGLTLFHAGIEKYIPPRKGQKHALRVIHEILAHRGNLGHEQPSSYNRILDLRSLLPQKRRRSPRTAQQATSISTALEFLMRSTKRRSVCFVVSDFFDQNYEHTIRSANRKHDVIAVQISDKRESYLPSVGMITLTDPETGDINVYDTSSRHFQKTFEALAKQRNTKLAQQFRSSGIDFIQIATSESVVDPLIKFFRGRDRRSRQ